MITNKKKRCWNKSDNYRISRTQRGGISGSWSHLPRHQTVFDRLRLTN